MLLHASVIVYVRVITPLQLPAVVTTSDEPTVRSAVAVQLSLADAPGRARKSVIVAAAAGRSVLHSRSAVVGAVAVGLVLSFTLKIRPPPKSLLFPSATLFRPVITPLQLPAVVTTSDEPT